MSSQALIEWLRRALRGFKKNSQDAARGDESGFTLVELLVVVAIMGVLAGIITPTVAHFASKGKTQAAATELQTVKSGIDAAIADNKLGTGDVCAPGNSSGIADFTGVDIDGTPTSSTSTDCQNGTIPLYPNYLSNAQVDTGAGVTGYCWNTLGIVVQKTTSNSATCPAPTPAP